jgi:hypothetical protein
MAIKGKGKTRTGRRPVARGPRPGYVEPPKPMYKQPWFRWVAGAIVVVGIVAIVFAIMNITASNNRKEARAARQHTKQGRVQQYAGPVVQYLQGIATPLPGGDQVAAFQDLSTQVKGLGSGQVSPADAKKAGTTDATNAKAVAAKINALPVSGRIVSGFPDLLDLLDSQEMLVESLNVYEQIGAGLANAADATGADRQALLARSQALLPVASQLFTDGYQKLINAQIKVNLPPTVFPAPTSPPSPSAAATPTPTPSAAPSPSGSGGGGKSGKGGGKHKPKPTASG